MIDKQEKFINGSLTSIEYIDELIKTCDSDHKKYLKQVENYKVKTPEDLSITKIYTKKVIITS